MSLKLLDIPCSVVYTIYMPAHLKYKDGVSVTIQMERGARDALKADAKKRHIPVSDLINERLKNPVSHVISLVK